MSIVETTAGFYCTDCGQHLGLGNCSGHVCGRAYLGTDLRAEVERLREALIKIHDLHPYCGCAGLVESLRPDVCEDNCAWSITRAALGETEKTHPMAQEMLATAARPVEELAGSTPCPECGFVKSHCRCAVPGEGEKVG